jgi:hypothetical protein
MMAFLKEKIVLETIRIIPEVIYEPIFLSTSHDVSKQCTSMIDCLGYQELGTLTFC